MKQGTKRLLSMAFALVMIVLSFVIFFEFIQPAYAELEEIQKKRLGKEQFLAEQKPAVDNVKKLISEYSGESFGQVRDSISLTLPSGPDLSSSMVQLEGLVRASSLNLQSLSPSAVAGATLPSRGALIKPVGSLSFKVSAIGSYSQVKDFFGKIESNILLFEIRSFSVQPLGKTGQDIFTINADIVSYYQQI